MNLNIPWSLSYGSNVIGIEIGLKDMSIVEISRVRGKS